MKIFLSAMTLMFCFAAGAFAQSDIRKVDFKNFTYNLSCGEIDKPSPLTVVNGSFEGDKNSLSTKYDRKVFLNINEVIYGDLNADGKAEAVVLYACQSGASYVYKRGLIFTMKNGKPFMQTIIEGGNKGDGGFASVKITNGKLIVKRYQWDTAESPCCPAFIETSRYKLAGKKLNLIGKATMTKVSKK